MKVYFTAATNNNGDYLVQERAIIGALKKLGATFTSGEQLLDHTKHPSSGRLAAAEIFRREKSAIESADCVVAEVTKPSSAVGMTAGESL